jgi:hypothetical protein
MRKSNRKAHDQYKGADPGRSPIAQRAIETHGKAQPSLSFTRLAKIPTPGDTSCGILFVLFCR